MTYQYDSVSFTYTNLFINPEKIKSIISKNI
nr:MAG TPA: hypothetical protein [Caudoviricetes sp.]